RPPSSSPLFPYTTLFRSSTSDRKLVSLDFFYLPLPRHIQWSVCTGIFNLPRLKVDLAKGNVHTVLCRGILILPQRSRHTLIQKVEYLARLGDLPASYNVIEKEVTDEGKQSTRNTV